jgi:PPK2 family polyphosphate:nucleotide phosphotransferase
MKLKPVTPKSSKKDVRLDDTDARVHGDVKSDDDLAKASAKETERISDLQRVFYADARHAMLIVLQGRDAAGKDGTIRKVFSAVNPQGCTVSSFKAPTELELRHDYLWRVHQQVPPRGMIGIFNRSHYEDVIVPRVRGWIDKKTWLARYDEINDFERMLSANGVVILKFLLHISRDEQKKRLEERLTDKEKNWKFRAGDLDDRRQWDDFTKAYRGILTHTSTKWAPWYVVPADDKPVRDWLIARTIADAMEALDPKYPAADPSVVGLEIE